MVQDNEVTRLGLVARSPEPGAPKSVVCIAPWDERAARRRLEGQPCVSFGSDFKIECDGSLNAFAFASNWTQDFIGAVWWAPTDRWGW
jgi:hypothetical protein